MNGGSTQLRPWRAAFAVPVTALLALVAGGCSEDPEPATAAELLQELEGRELSAVEETEQLATMEWICDFDDSLLAAMWAKLDDEQLRYQDIAFGRICPERNALYAQETGRFATDE